jgi:hypothetical protein
LIGKGFYISGIGLILFSGTAEAHVASPIERVLMNIGITQFPAQKFTEQVIR